MAGNGQATEDIPRATPAGAPPPRGFHDYAGVRPASAFRTYQDLIVGERGMLPLVRYECLTTLLTFMPGAAGLFLRQKLYRLILGGLGSRAVIGVGVGLRQPRKIQVGAGAVIDDYACLSVRGGDAAGIRIGEHALVGRQSVVSAKDAQVQIGRHTTVGSSCRLASVGGGVQVGEYAMIAAYCYIGGGGHRSERMDVPMALQGDEGGGGVVIEDDVWLGAGTIVVDGVRVGKGTIIGAASFVNRDIPAYSVAYGCPARVARTRTGSA